MPRRRLAAALAVAAIAVAGAPMAALAQVQTVTLKNGASQAVTQTVDGFDITGTYGSIDNGEPMVVLNPDGSGSWKGDTGEAMRPIKWWIAADPAGKALIQISPNGQAHTLIVDYGGGDISGWELAIAKQPRQIYINRERVKAY